MVIYKITNTVDGNVYIGQTTKSAESRFKEHCRDALSGRLNTALAQAIRKYGVDFFEVEEIEAVDSPDMLDEREAYWIDRYDSVRYGYNMTAGGDGGNTYASKSPAEMEVICQKIRESKLGALNPNHRKVKCLNLFNHQELHFTTLTECMEHFGENANSFIVRRCSGATKYLYKGEWLFSYEENDYSKDYKLHKKNRKSRKVFVTDLETNRSGLFPSYAEAERYFGLRPKALSSKASKKSSCNFVLRKRYDITIIE